MESWLDFRIRLKKLQVESGEKIRPLAAMSQNPPFRQVPNSTLAAYFVATDKRVGDGNWEVIENILRLIQHAADARQNPLVIDFGAWQRDWQRLEDRTAARPTASGNGDRQWRDGWIGGWDGAADAVFSNASAHEFTLWPPGQGRLDCLARTIGELSSAYEPEVARLAAQRLAVGAEAEFGKDSPLTLAARHAVAFWTGYTGSYGEAFEMTKQLRADCLWTLGKDHLLSRLALLRSALWLSRLGRWQEANRRYSEAVHAESEMAKPDRLLWLLARWGMARTGGRTGRWLHGYVELDELLPEMTKTFGIDHPASYEAGDLHAWAAGRAGHPELARSLLEDLVDRAGAALGPGHPLALRVGISLAYWTRIAGTGSVALPMATAAREECERTLGPEHPISVAAQENEAICQLDINPEAALRKFDKVLKRRMQNFGPQHPHTRQARLNHAIARAKVRGAEVALHDFRVLAEELISAVGSDHPDTLRARLNQVIATMEVSGKRAALPPAIRVHEALERVLGEEHPDTVAAAELVERIRNHPEPDPDGDGPSSDPARPAGPEWTSPSYWPSSEEAASDRDLKCGITPVAWRTADVEASTSRPAVAHRKLDGFEVLRAVEAMPVSTWSYRGEEGVRHLGPMAQDWHAALGLGADRSIHLADVNGVSLVAVQALAKLVKDLQGTVAELEKRLEEGGGERPSPSG